MKQNEAVIFVLQNKKRKNVQSTRQKYYRAILSSELQRPNRRQLVLQDRRSLPSPLGLFSRHKKTKLHRITQFKQNPNHQRQQNGTLEGEHVSSTLRTSRAAESRSCVNRSRTNSITSSLVITSHSLHLKSEPKERNTSDCPPVASHDYELVVWRARQKQDVRLTRDDIVRKNMVLPKLVLELSFCFGISNRPRYEQFPCRNNMRKNLISLPFFFSPPPNRSTDRSE